jgi:isopentenyl diphosphate isomerase/L-lactate dehydrogenase-like FMN-dependent dehydrogenase
VAAVVQDAEKALEHGVNGIIVSNHGEIASSVWFNSPSARGVCLTVTFCLSRLSFPPTRGRLV